MVVGYAYASLVLQKCHDFHGHNSVNILQIDILKHVIYSNHVSPTR